jgi:predicted outer membrane lipoprotein
MAAIGKWLVGVVLGWAFDLIKGLVEAYMARKKKEKEVAEDNKAAEQKLEEAESEQEVIDAGGDLLKR